MMIAKTFGLFVPPAFAEIVGCYLPSLWLKNQGSAWLLVPAACSLALFAWLLSLRPAAAGRVYAPYGGVYISVVLLWLIDSVRPRLWDLIGVAVSLSGMGIIMCSSRSP
jgi:small multidrug resistance family-3 protein